MTQAGLLYLTYMGIGIFLGIVFSSFAFLYLKKKDQNENICLNKYEIEKNLLHYTNLLNDKDFIKEMSEVDVSKIKGKVSVWSELLGRAKQTSILTKKEKMDIMREVEQLLENARKDIYPN